MQKTSFPNMLGLWELYPALGLHIVGYSWKIMAVNNIMFHCKDNEKGLEQIDPKLEEGYVPPCDIKFGSEVFCMSLWQEK